MKNKYKIDGDTTIIYLEKRSGEIFEALIDTEDLERVLNYKYTWHPCYARNLQCYYAKATEYIGIINEKPKYKTVYLHRFIMNEYARNKHIDHINHNILDNRKSNLCITNNEKNLINRQGLNKNNKTGYRNVSYSKSENKYIVQLQINGKNKILGKFDDVEDAGEFAEAMRIKYYKTKYENIQ